MYTPHSQHPLAARFLVRLLLFVALAAAASAQDPEPPGRPTLEQLQRMISDMEPVVRADSVDQERITTRRIDIVDESGTIRLTLSAPAPPPRFDGIEYRRAFDVSGITIYDEHGSERGGFGYAEVPGGAAVMALDHPTMDAVGFRVMPDGSVMFAMNQAPPEVREPALGNRRILGVESANRVRMLVAANGTPSLELADEQSRTRLRLTVTEEGFGAIEFLNAAGEVIHTFAPERAGTRP